jgi:transposase
MTNYQPTLEAHSTVVGVDVHKYCHTAVAMDRWGKEKGKLDFSNDSLASYTAWLLSFGERENTLVALEDVNSYGVHLVETLSKEGFAIRYVPAILTERERKQSTKRHKSDYVDAKRVAKVILTKYEETLPAKESIADEEELKLAQSLDLLLMERRDMVKAKTALKNQLHALLHQYYGDHYADPFPKAFHPKAVSFYLEDLTEKPKIHKLILGGSIERRLKRLVTLEAEITGITEVLENLAKSSAEIATLVSQIHGCGLLTASSIMAELTTIKRFATKDKLAMYSGTAPIEKSSGRKQKLHTNPFGNRQLNKALHTIALSQISRRSDNRGKVYYQKKLKEGKTKLWAMRCLKRQIINRVFKVLKNTV